MEIRLWRELLVPYELAVKELVMKFNQLKKEHKEKDLYCPIEQVSGRVKSINSILEKMQRKNVSWDELEEKIEDIAGIRVICQFYEDIEIVADIIRRRSDMKVLEIKDYLTHTKASGYRSYHMIIAYHTETLEGEKEIRAEIQIRTLAMNFWATIEHSLQYKYKGNMPPHLTERLSRAADSILQLDEEMSSVRNEVMDAQNSMIHESNVVADILNNIENLYHYSNKREVAKIQDEFYRIYQTKNLENLERFHRELDIIAEGYRAQALTFELDGKS
nr:GTP pyrophosphokinase family protein [uncultured Blautia sp.]